MALFGTKKEGGKGEKVKRYAKARAHADGKAHTIILAPWFSEKALLATERGVYAFAIPRAATKADVAGAIEEIFNVRPKQIRIVNTPGKKVSLRKKRGFGRRAARRKAYVYLHAGETIQFA